MRTSLVTDALAMAITHGRIQPGAVFHSDAAPSTPRRSSLGSATRTASGPASAGPARWDNVAAESFFGALKNEMCYRQAFPDRARARFAVADYIEVSISASGCTQPSATARLLRHSPNSRPQQPLHDQ